MKRPMMGLLVGGMVVAAASPAAAQFTAGADLVSTYVFRGYDVTDGVAIQPWGSVALGATGLSATVWSSFAVQGREEMRGLGGGITRGGADEVDLTLAYNRSAGPLSFGLGYIAYFFPASELDYTTQEVFGTVGLAGLPLTPAVSLFYDFDGQDPDDDDADEIEGLYLNAGVTHSLPVGLPLNLGANIGFSNQEALRLTDSFEPNDINLSVGTPIPFGPVTFTPTVRYTWLLGGDEVESDGTFYASLGGSISLP